MTELDLHSHIAAARNALPASHRALIEQLGLDDAIVDEWPRGVQALYETLGLVPPGVGVIAGAVAAWLPDLSVVAFNGPLLAHALGDADATTRQAAIDGIAWHEYGHALSVVRASSEMRSSGPRLVELLPPGLRRAIDFPGSYKRREVFDEVIANVYALMVSRAVHHHDYGVPDFLHADVFEAFRTVIPWPPER